MAAPFDPRTTPVRDDLVAASFADRFPRPHIAEGIAHRAVTATAPLSFAAEAEARRESELLFGESFTVYDVADGWAWGQSALDGYVGYVPAAALAPGAGAPNHLVAVLASHLYPAPDLKRRQTARLSLGARVEVVAERDGYAEIAGGGWLFARHLAPIDAAEPDYVATARRFLGAPYLWGGRSAGGLDCSGLVQVALQRGAIACPRDTDMQAASLGEPLPSLDPETWRRGDLVFFAGHVGIVTEGGGFLHANATHMATVEEPLADVLARAEAAGSGVTVVRRLS